MGSVSRLGPRRAGLTVGGAVAAFLDTLEDTGTRRNYAGTLRALAARFGSGAPLVTLEDPEFAAAVAAWFPERWGEAAPATFNRNLDTLRSAVRYWMEQDWLAADPTSGVRRRRRAPDRTRALSRAEIDELLTRKDIALREKTLWRMLYETAARANEVLSLDVGDLDLRNRNAKVRRKGGAMHALHSSATWPSNTSLMFVTVATHEACTHEGRLCRPDNLTPTAAASGGGREGDLSPSR